MNNKTIQIAVFAVLTVALLAVLRKTDSMIIGFDFQDAFASTANDKSFSRQEFLSVFENLTVNGNEITSSTNDPRLFIDIKGLPWYKYVKLDVDLLNRETTNAQIFLEKNNDGMNDANSIKFKLKNGLNYVRIFTEPSFQLLRFDPAEEAGVSLRINSITLTPHYSPKVFDAVKIVLLFIIGEAIFGLLCFSARGAVLLKRIGEWFMSTEDE